MAKVSYEHLEEMAKKGMNPFDLVTHINGKKIPKEAKSKAIAKKKGMSKKTMKAAEKGDLGGFMKEHYPK